LREERTVQTIIDLDLPEIKPAVELYRGVRRQKVSPRFTHAHLQGRIAAILGAWARGRGRVGTEWRFYFLEQSGAPSSSLVADVAYVSFERLPYEADHEAEQPRIAPDIAVEILSPDDRQTHVREKIALYLAYGTACVVIVDPKQESMTVHTAGTAEPRSFSGAARVHLTPDLTLDLAEIFAPLEPPGGVRFDVYPKTR